MKKIITLIAGCFLIISVFAARVDTIVIYSEAMQKSFKCVVIQPGTRSGIVKWPVVYLLHGYSGDYSNWINRVPLLSQYADDFNLMIVCPDGGYSSWYLDSPVDPNSRYETYIAKEVPSYIDKNYPTIADRSGRAITGLSMGGHGGMFLGFRHADTFGACGSMSGGMDLYATRNKYDLIKRVGDTITHAANWEGLSVINVIEQYPKDSLAIIIDCGTEDFFYSSNQALHAKMLGLKIPHEYIERPGKHDWNYWRNAVKYQLLFFRNYFIDRNFF